MSRLSPGPQSPPTPGTGASNLVCIRPRPFAILFLTKIFMFQERSRAWGVFIVHDHWTKPPASQATGSMWPIGFPAKVFPVGLGT